jgi:hypothetical protein
MGDLRAGCQGNFGGDALVIPPPCEQRNPAFGEIRATSLAPLEKTWGVGMTPVPGVGRALTARSVRANPPSYLSRAPALPQQDLLCAGVEGGGSCRYLAVGSSSTR